MGDLQGEEVEESQGWSCSSSCCWWWWQRGQRTPQPDPLLDQPAGRDQRDDAQHALQSVPWFQGGQIGRCSLPLLGTPSRASRSPPPPPSRSRSARNEDCC